MAFWPLWECGCCIEPRHKSRSRHVASLRTVRSIIELGDRLRDAVSMSPPNSCADIIRSAWPALSVRQSKAPKTARIERLIRQRRLDRRGAGRCSIWNCRSGSSRRIAYDEGEWYCALSRQRELPDWLDQSIEARHADLALAILSAFVEAQRISAPSSRTSVPTVPRRRRRHFTSRSAAAISRKAANAAIPRLTETGPAAEPQCRLKTRKQKHV